MNARFTIDGSVALERQLARICHRAGRAVQALVPASQLEALVLGGGYGRGQGGVLRTDAGDEPYNDLEFYVFCRGLPVLNQARFGRALTRLGDALSQEARLHIEFKVDSLARLRRSPVTMFSYDLVTGHRVLWGRNPFKNCEHHLDAAAIPLSEATRLLFNRCSGLLLAREMLHAPSLDAEHSDFIGRNFAKLQLAMGDAVLTSFEQYHFSCLERRRRLERLELPEPPSWFRELRERHQLGVQFKLHPRRILKSRAVFQHQLMELSRLSLEVWLWLEGRRLARPFGSARDYAFGRQSKLARTPRWRNLLLNLRSFGLPAAFGPMAFSYPRERLFNALCLLLWNPGTSLAPAVRRCLREQLRTTASDWTGFVARYKTAWSSYG